MLRGQTKDRDALRERYGLDSIFQNAHNEIQNQERYPRQMQAALRAGKLVTAPIFIPDGVIESANFLLVLDPNGKPLPQYSDILISEVTDGEDDPRTFSLVHEGGVLSDETVQSVIELAKYALHEGVYSYAPATNQDVPAPHS